MASSKVVIKNNKTEAVYKFVNDDTTPVTFTVTMAELARSDQTIVGTPKAAISSISFNTSQSISILRNSVLQWYLTGDSEHTQAAGADNQNSDQTITVQISSGTLVLRLIKNEAYKDA